MRSDVISEDDLEGELPEEGGLLVEVHPGDIADMLFAGYVLIIDLEGAQPSHVIVHGRGLRRAGDEFDA